MIKRVQSYAQNPVFWGALLSLLLIGTVIYWASWAKTVSYLAPRTNFEVFLASRPNEVGDLLAGVAGALAFIWIIVTVWLQSKELAAQREELTLTCKEMAAQRKATEEMAISLAAQAEIFQDEKKERLEARAHRSLLRKLEFVRNTVAELASENYAAAWLMDLTALYREGNGMRRGNPINDKHIFEAFDPNANFDQAFFVMADRSRDKLVRMIELIGPRKPAEELPDEMFQCLGILEEIQETQKQLSEEDRTYLKVLRIEDTLGNWRGIMNLLVGEVCTD